jgi:hypothetical protein
MVKWLKIDRQDKTRRRRQEIGQVAIYYWRRAKMQAVVALHSLAVLARSKQKTIPEYAAQATKH